MSDVMWCSHIHSQIYVKITMRKFKLMYLQHLNLLLACKFGVTYIFIVFMNTEHVHVSFWGKTMHLCNYIYLHTPLFYFYEKGWLGILSQKMLLHNLSNMKLCSIFICTVFFNIGGWWYSMLCSLLNSA